MHRNIFGQNFVSFFYGCSQNQNALCVWLGLFLSDLLPTPADAVYFSYQRNNKQKLEEGKITPKQYWFRDAVGYYGFNPIWWASVFGSSALIGKNFAQKRNIFIGLIAGGIVLSVLNKNIIKEEEFYSQT